MLLRQPIRRTHLLLPTPRHPHRIQETPKHPRPTSSPSPFTTLIQRRAASKPIPAPHAVGPALDPRAERAMITRPRVRSVRRELERLPQQRRRLRHRRVCQLAEALRVLCFGVLVEVRRVGSR